MKAVCYVGAKNLFSICPSMHGSIWSMLKWGGLETLQSSFDSKSYRSSNSECQHSDLLRRCHKAFYVTAQLLCPSLDAVSGPS